MFGAAAVHPVPVVRARSRVQRGRLHVPGRREVPAQQEDPEEKVRVRFLEVFHPKIPADQHCKSHRLTGR